MKILRLSFGGFGFRSALRTELSTRRQFVLAVRALRFFLRRSAFGTEFCAFTELSPALHARDLRDFHFAAAVGAKLRCRIVLFSARRTRHRRR